MPCINSIFIKYDFSYNLGSGVTTITANWLKVNDDQWHTILVSRQGRFGNLTVDGRSITDFARPSATQLNADNYLYIGKF